MPLLSTLAAISPYALPVAQSYLSGRRQQKDEKRFGKAQARANLINTLAPGAGAQPVFKPSDPGFLERGVQAANVGLGAYQGWQKFQQAQTAAQQAIDAAEEAKQIREGRERAVADLLRRDKAEDKMADLVTQQRDQLAEGPRRQIQTEAAAMSTLDTSPETFDPRLFATKPKAADLTTRPVEPMGSERGVPGAGPGFGTPSSQMQAAQDMMGGQPAPLPTGPAGVGYYEVMAEDRQRRFKESLDVEAQALQQRRLEFDQQRVEEQSVYQRRKLEADEAAHKAANVYRLSQNIQEHQTQTEKTVRGFSSVKRLAEFRSNHQAMLDLIQNIKDRQAEARANRTTYDIRGTDQIALLNFYQNMIDPATVKEGDVHLYRTQAQGLFTRIETQLGIIFDDKSGVVSDQLLKDMGESLDILQGGYETAASEQIGHYFKSQTEMGYELIPQAVTTALRNASFTAYDLVDPVESRAQLEQQIKNVQESFKSRGSVSGGPFTQPPSSSLGAGEGVLMRTDSPADTFYTAPAEGGDLSASTQPPGSVTPSMGFAETSQLGAVTADTDFNLDHLYDAIVMKESSNDHTAINPDSGAIGLGQVLKSNVPDWSRQILGREITWEQFAADPKIQETIIRGKLEQFYTEELQNANGDFEEAIKRVASRWYSGQGDWFDSTKPQEGNYPTIQKYANSIYDSVSQRGARRETSATLSAPTEDTTVSAAPETILAKIGGGRPQLGGMLPQIGGARGAMRDQYASQTDFSRMTDDEKRKLLGETAVDYAGRGGRFAYDNILQPLGALAAGTLPRIYGYKQPGNKR